MSKKSKMGFLGGALVGLGLGFLFAPKSGSETRKELAKQTSMLWDKVRSMDADEIKDKLENKLNSSSQIFEEPKICDNDVKKKKIFETDSDPYLLAKFLEKCITENNPKFPQSESQRQRWAKERI